MWLLNHHLLKLCSTRFTSGPLAHLCLPSLPLSSSLHISSLLWRPSCWPAWWRSSLKSFLLFPRLSRNLDRLGPEILFRQSKISEVLGGSGYNSDRLSTPYVPQLTGMAWGYVCRGFPGAKAKKVQIVVLGIELIFPDSWLFINKQRHKFLVLISVCLKIFFSVYW